jgi:putative Holliday junction resolvase
MIAALDIGLKRIGVAICPDGKIVMPQTAIVRKNRNQAARDVDTFLIEWDVQCLVVGIPKGGSSQEEMCRRIEHFVSLLDFSGDIFYHDEYGSSQEAKEMMMGKIRQKRDGKIDSIAAGIILQRWLTR